MRDQIARRHYKRALASSASLECLLLEADGAGGRACWHRLLIVGDTLGCLGMRRDLEARTATHGIARWRHDSERCFGDEPCFLPHVGALGH